MNQKTLILSSNNGGGHNAVAAAISELYTARGEEADIVDAMSFLPRGWSKLVSDIHSFAYRNTPGLFRYGYELSEKHREEFDSRHLARRLLNLGVTKLGRYIKDGGYDAVICCHVFAGMMLTDAIRKFSLNIISGIVETDYTVSPGAEESRLDWHFVPTQQLREQLSGYGVPEDRIVVSGIPIRDQFYQIAGREAARAELGISHPGKNITITCGSMGCGPIAELVRLLLEGQEPDESISVICGSNKKLYKHLSMEYGHREDVYIYGNVQNMSLHLDASDVYMTKPGGISTTEAASRGVPMVLINAVGGCEKYNMDLYVQAGGAVTSDTTEGLAAEAVHICRDETMSDNMKKSLAAVFDENNKEIIYRYMHEAGMTGDR